MLGVITIWGVNFTAVKFALKDFTPLDFNALRFGFATLIMLTLVWRRNGGNLNDLLYIPFRDLARIVLLGLCGHTAYQIAFINGLARTTASNSSMLMATSPIFVAIYGSLFGVERTNRTTWAGILLSFAGIAALIGGGSHGFSLQNGATIGDLLVLIAAALWAAYTVMSKPLLVRYSPLKVTAYSMLAGTPPLILASLPDLLRQDWGSIQPFAWGGLAYSTILSVVVSYIIWSTSVQRVGNARTAIYSNLTPVVGIIVSAVVLGDKLTIWQMMGAAIVLAGLLLTRRGRTR